MGSTRTRAALTAAAAAVLTVAACSGSGDDDDAGGAATADTAPAGEQTLSAQAGEEADAANPAAPSPAADITPVQVAGQQLAIEARATMQADDVRAAVDRITTTVVTRGGRVAAADIDYARPDADDDAAATSRATLVVSIPPEELPAVRDSLEEIGDVLSYDQLAEDVSEQLTDLDTRITNQRASIERIRQLYAEAVDIDTIVRIEAELTNRETALEQLLASQQALEERVAMSTLTIDIATTPDALEAIEDDDDPGIADALAAGWSAFAGGVFALILALSAALPFLLTALAIALAVLWIRQLTRRRPTPISAPPEREPVSASRPE